MSKMVDLESSSYFVFINFETIVQPESLTILIMKYLYFFLVTMLFLSSCEEDAPMWFDNEYVFLEQHLSEYSEFVKGDFSMHVCIDFPMYQFDSNKGTILCYSDFDMTKKTRMALGMGMSASGVASSGAGTGVEEVNDLPYERFNLTIERIDEDGTVYFSYKDSSMVLSPDEEWSTVTTRLDTITWENMDEETYELFEDTTVIQYTYTDRVTHWGKLNKEDFELYNFE